MQYQLGCANFAVNSGRFVSNSLNAFVLAVAADESHIVSALLTTAFDPGQVCCSFQ